ncbi:M50 family metallopeptidase [Chitinivorax sp. B]|uniref:M50 family metallopeptidase n=1 Tax=Chitinivorax sp. B TaxID=2502235 RepID=UPI0010FA5E0B|nr:M50 family metallopeptidase [Chitinivorax sp. B]
MSPLLSRPTNLTSTLPLQSRWQLILILAVTVGAWQFPLGAMALYPFSLLATYVHELGHGLTALATGAHFDQLLLYADGSGMAIWRGHPTPLSLALIAAGGLIGPSLAGALLLALSRTPRFARLLLAVQAGLTLIIVLVWVRNLFGVIFLLAVSALMAGGARWLSDRLAQFILQWLAALFCLSWFRDLDYMFSAQATVNGVVSLSDSAQMAAALWLPYWFWGGLVALTSFVLLVAGLWFATRPIR